MPELIHTIDLDFTFTIDYDVTPVRPATHDSPAEGGEIEIDAVWLGDKKIYPVPDHLYDAIMLTIAGEHDFDA